MKYPPNQKPPIWAIDPGIVAYNCRKYGMPHPVLAMPMWEGAGNRALDYSGRGNHGILTDGPSWVTNGVSFDGTDDYINTGINGISVNTGSFCAWVKRIGGWSSSETDDEYIFEFGISNDDRVVLYLNDNGQIRFLILDNNVADIAYTTETSWNEQWYHLVGVYGPSLLRLYVDAVSQVDDTSIGTIEPITTLSIGGDNLGAVGTNFFTGIINNCSIFNTTLTQTQVKFLYENPYFMYEIPEELYGYAAAVGDTATNLLHGKIIIKDSSIILVDGLLKVQDISTDLFDGKLKVQDIDTDLADGLIKVQDSATGLADGKVQIQDSVTDLADGKVIVTTVGADTGQADGKIQIKDVTTGIVDGLVKVKDSVTGLADGKVKISNIASNLADGLIRIKDTATGIADGKVRIKDVATGTADGLLKIIEKATSNVDGKLKIKDTIKDLADGKISITGAAVAVIRRISIANKKPSYRLVAEQPKTAYRLKTENK